MDFDKLCVYEVFPKTRPYYVLIEYKLILCNNIYTTMNLYSIASILINFITSRI